MDWRTTDSYAAWARINSSIGRSKLLSGSWKGLTRASTFDVGGSHGRFKKCFTCCNVLAIRRFAVDKQVKDGRAEMCFECVKNVTGRVRNRQKKKQRTKWEEKVRARNRLARHVWVFPGNYTFPRAEMFRPGISLWRVFEEASKKKLKTGRKI